MCAFVVLDLVFPYQDTRLAWGTSPKWPVLCWVGRKTLTQSVNQSEHSAHYYDIAAYNFLTGASVVRADGSTAIYVDFCSMFV